MMRGNNMKETEMTSELEISRLEAKLDKNLEIINERLDVVFKNLELTRSSLIVHLDAIKGLRNMFTNITRKSDSTEKIV